MDFIKRIGTDRHKFKIQFFLKKLACNAKLKGEVYVKIKRGDHKASSQNKVSLEDDGTCNFGKQILTFDSLTLFYDSEKKAYQQKQGEVSVIIITKKGDKKLLGSFQIDVAQYANSNKENISVKKQFGQKIKAVLQFDVFIKCLGQASQKSKSIDKPLDRKKQSSLSKFTSFFVGNKNQDEQNSQEQTNVKPKKKERTTQRQRQSSQEKKDNFKYYSNVVKRNDAAASQKKVPQKQQKKKKVQKQQSNSDDGSEGNTPQKPPKNLVKIKEKDNFTQVEYTEQNNKVNAKKKLSTPQQQQIYFDQPNSYVKKKNDTDYNDQSQKPNKMKRTENSGYTKQTYEPKQPPQNFNKKVNEFTIKNQKNDRVQNNQSQKIAQFKQKNLTLLKQNKQLKAQNLKLTQQNKSLNKKIQAMDKNRSTQDFYSTERQNNSKKADDEKTKALQKQKGQLIFKVQKLEQRCKKQSQKYEQIIEKLQQDKKQLQQASKAEIKRLKEQFSEQKQQNDKLMSKYQQKAKQAKQFKQKQNDLKQRLAIAQNSLSQIKLKIGDKLNEANQQGNRTVIDILTLLYQ